MTQTPELDAATKALYASAKLLTLAFEANALTPDDGTIDLAAVLVMQDAITYDEARAGATGAPRVIRTPRG